MEKHHIEVMLSEEKVDARIKELGEQISRDYAYILPVNWQKELLYR